MENMRQIIIIIAMCFISLLAHAQASGEQIRRQSINKTIRKKQQSKSSTEEKKDRKRIYSSTKKDNRIDVLEIIPITYANINGKDLSETIVKAQLEIIIYIDGNKLFMSNNFRRDNTKRWGQLFVLDQKEEPESTTQYETVTMQCSWNYQYSWKGDRGTVPVTIQLIKKKKGIHYTITINGDELITYRGIASSEEQTSSSANTTPIDIIQPISITNLYRYNIVCGTYSQLVNASTFCSQLRARGYKDAQIYLDEKNFYRVISDRFFDEQEALNYRNMMRATYSDAWILYINNGKEERYFK